ncbi:MAG: hypothetical protein FWH12_02265 [Treponema sp.]|nr:hypothetical protein [Treponema sp.]
MSDIIYSVNEALNYRDVLPETKKARETLTLSEIAQTLIWMSNNLRSEWEAELQSHKRQGWKIISRSAV